MANPHCRIGAVKPRGNVYLFPGTVSPELPARAQPHPRIIGFLREMLARAERGDIQGVAAAWISADGSTASNWEGGGDHSCSLLLGTIHMLAADFATTSLDRAKSEGYPQEPA